MSAFSLWIDGSGGFDSVINGVGGPATNTSDSNHAPVDAVSHP